MCPLPLFLFLLSFGRAASLPLYHHQPRSSSSMRVRLLRLRRRRRWPQAALKKHFSFHLAELTTAPLTAAAAAAAVFVCLDEADFCFEAKEADWLEVYWRVSFLYELPVFLIYRKTGLSLARTELDWFFIRILLPSQHGKKLGIVGKGGKRLGRRRGNCVVDFGSSSRRSSVCRGGARLASVHGQRRLRRLRGEKNY